LKRAFFHNALTLAAGFVNDDATVHRAVKYAWGTAIVCTEYLYKNGSRQVNGGALDADLD
jgi:hypothetical protein